MRFVKMWCINNYFLIVLLFVFFFHPQFSTGIAGELKRVVVIVTMPVDTCEAQGDSLAPITYTAAAIFNVVFISLSFR